MTVTYLRRVDIDEFRAYRKGFSLDVPSGPGLTLLVGPNGSGKTALFDAIEWCLTGQVHRLSELPDIDGSRNRQYYGRFTPQREADYSCRVSLDFTGGEVVRTQVYGPDGIPQGDSQLGETDPVRLLTSPPWTTQVDRESLPAYLRATHLLTQAADARWGRGRDNKARSACWDDLTHLSGEDLFNRVLHRLTSRATAQAFNQIVTDRERDLRDAQRRLDDWNERIQRKRALEQSAALDDIASPAHILAQLADIRAHLLQQWRDQAPVHPLDETLPEAMLEWCRAFVRQLSAHLSARRERLEQAGLLPARWAESEARRLRVKGLSEAARQDLDTAREQFDAAVTSVDKAQVAVEERERKRYEALEQRDSLLRIREAQRRLPELRQRTSEIEKETADLNELLQMQAERVAEAKHRISIREKTTARVTELQAIAERVRDQISRASPIMAAYNGLPELHTEQERLLRSSTDMDKKLTRSAATRHEAEAALNRAEQGLVARRQQATKVQNALSVIAADISEKDLTCPVCSSRWQEGELRRRALQAADAENHLLLHAEEEAQALRERVEAMRLEQAELAEEQSALKERLNRLSERERKIINDFAALAEWPDVRGGTPRDPLGSLEKALDRVRQETATLEGALAGMPDQAQLSVELSSADAATVETNRRLASSRETLVRLRGELAQIDALLSTSADIIARVDASSNGWDEEIRQGADAVAEAEEGLAAAKSALTSAEIEVARLKQTVLDRESKSRDLDAELQRLIETQNGLTQAWTASGLPGHPTSEIVVTEKQRLASSEQARSELDLELNRCGRSLKAWGSQEQLASVERELDARMHELGADRIEEVPDRLEADVKRQEQRLAKAKQAQEAARRLGTAARAAADDYSDRVLTPLNDLASAFSDALTIQSPLDVRLRAHTARGTTQLMTGASFRGAEGSPLSAAHILSEGQMAAASFVQLLSMHVTYPWSTWRGLLLDDPLQYNDILSVAAFIDLIRNLIRVRGYQIILSTHDGDLADFILRKLDASRHIDWCLCEYAGSSSLGATVSTRCVKTDSERAQ